MKYCVECGNKLVTKFLEHEGDVPFCNKCNLYRFPIFSTAVSMVVLNETKDKTLFIQQYGNKRNILVAGYVNKGETAEEAVKRELFEEIGVIPIDMQFQKSLYWEKSNTLVFNYVVSISGEVKPNYEVDSYEWYSLDDALDSVAKGGLAEEFYKMFYKKNNVLKNVL